MRLADSHIHLFRYGYRHDGLPSLFGAGEVEAYEAIRQFHDIELALVVGYEADGIDPDNNAYIRDLSTSHRWIRTIAYVDPGSRSEVGEIAALLDQGHSGLALYVNEPDRVQALLAWPREVWSLLQERKAILSLNVRRESIAPLRPLIAAVPDVSFLLSHLGLPGVLRSDMPPNTLHLRLAPLMSLADLPNAFVKISGLYAVSEPPHAYPHAGAAVAVRQILSTLGPSRCLWGSDFAPALEFISFPQAVHWPGLDELSESARDAVMGGNLMRLVG